MTPADPYKDQDEDPSIVAHDFMGTVLGTREIALAIAEMLVNKYCTKEYARSQMPLSISDDGDRWIIEGRTPPDESAPLHEQQSRIIIKIRKRNCQITSCTGAIGSVRKWDHFPDGEK